MADQQNQQQDGGMGVIQPPGDRNPSQGMFKKSSPVDLSTVYDELNSLSARMRMNEERYANLRKKSQLIEQNMLTSHKNTNVEVKTIITDINELKRDIIDIQSKMKMMINELQTFAKKDEVKTLEKYVNLWDPLKFITSSEAEKIINEIIDEKLGKLQK